MLIEGGAFRDIGIEAALNCVRLRAILSWQLSLSRAFGHGGLRRLFGRLGLGCSLGRALCAPRGFRGWCCRDRASGAEAAAAKRLSCSGYDGTDWCTLQNWGIRRGLLVVTQKL